MCGEQTFVESRFSGECHAAEGKQTVAAVMHRGNM